jgi:FixJ family two-component response regulator
MRPLRAERDQPGGGRNCERQIMAKRQKTIAIIDDNAALTKALARLLSVLGYRAELYASAEDFLSAAAASNAVCLLVDIQLGEVSGLDMVRHLCAAGSRVPVIFMTGSEHGTIRDQSTALGAKAFLLKPFPITQLIDAIEQAIGNRPKGGR